MNSETSAPIDEAFSPTNDESADCVFDKIIRKEIPANILHEGEKTLAFLDISPDSPGHTLVIPKKHVRNIFDVDEATLAAMMETVRKITPAVLNAVGAKGAHINSNHESAAGQLVFHLHFHIIPRHDRSEFEFWPKIDTTPAEMAIIAEKIRKELSTESI